MRFKFDAEVIREQAMAELAGSFDQDTDRHQAVTDYINRMTNEELLDLIERASN